MRKTTLITLALLIGSFVCLSDCAHHSDDTQSTAGSTAGNLSSSNIGRDGALMVLCIWCFSIVEGFILNWCPLIGIRPILLPSTIKVTGDMPAASKLVMYNLFNDPIQLGYVWIGQFGNAGYRLNHILQAEAAVGASATDRYLHSGGSYVDVTVGSGTETTIFTWPLGDDFMSVAAGRWFKLLARFGTLMSNYDNWRFRFKLYYGADVWVGPQVIPTALPQLQIRDLGTVQLPPWLAGLNYLEQIELRMTAYQETGSDQHVYLDYIQVTPVDGWRHIAFNGYGLSYGEQLIDDGPEELTYSQAVGGGDRAAFLTPYGAPLMVQPYNY